MSDTTPETPTVGQAECHWVILGNEGHATKVVKASDYSTLAEQLAQAQGEVDAANKRANHYFTARGQLDAAQGEIESLRAELATVRAECERLRVSSDAWDGVKDHNIRLIEESNRLRAENADLAKGYEQMREALQNLLTCSECADETGYVMDIDAIQEAAHAALVKHQP